MKASNRRPVAQDAMLGMATGYWVSQLVYVAAELGIADVLARGPATPASIAKRIKADAPSVHRLLRALASVGVFAETSKGRFRLTPAAATLRSDVPGSLRNFVRMVAAQYNWNAWGDLLHGIRSGEIPFEHVYGVPHFDYLRDNPEEDRLFSASMASISGPENDAVARGYDFSRFGTLADVGGAHGHLLATILRRHRRLRGILFDQPQVVAGARKSGFITATAVKARIHIEGGSFFAAVPRGADAYLLKYILHDWTDEQAVQILSHCREAMAPGGRVLAVEHVIEKGNAADWAKLLDINMLVLPGGRERTRDQFRDLFAAAGLRLRKVHATSAALKILEASA